MHPAFLVSENDELVPDTTSSPYFKEGKLILDNSSGNIPASIYVGSINPYATYDIDIESIDSVGTESAEVGIDLARYGLRDRVQLIAKQGSENGIFLRIYQNAKVIREDQYLDSLPGFPFTLRLQLYGRTLGIFTEKDGVTNYHGHLDDNSYGDKVKGDHFGDVLDFRQKETNKFCSFNIVSNLNGKVVIGGARSYLSPGIGQADIRVVSYEDLEPYLDKGRLWFTFTIRGIGLSHPTQGVLSVDPSVFDVRFEGVIVFDFGDGYIRNAVATHLFYDRNAKEWRAYSCDFGGSYKMEGRSESHLFAASSKKDPRRGFSVMKADLIANEALPGHHEDPCIFYDKHSGNW